MAVADVTRLHVWHHADYDLAKREIHQALGDLGGLKVWGRQVAVAVYVRPEVNPTTGIYQPMTAMKEDWWQGKSVLIIKCGPDAFKGDESYIDATFPDGLPPRPGDWLFANANAGIQTSFMGRGASQPLVENRQGEMVPIYDWHGWPIRIISDTDFLGQVDEPHMVI